MAATRKHRSRGGRSRTQRRRKVGGDLSVEGLHASFERIDGRMRQMIERGRTDSELRCCLRKVWSEQFHHRLSEPAVAGMIQHYRATSKRVTRKAKAKSQRGGMAPLDYTMGQGITSQVYGRFPLEMSNPATIRAFDVDRFSESAIARSCDTTGGHAAPDTQTGGGFFDALLTPHAPASVPMNVLDAGLRAIQGVNTGPSASPIAASVPTVSAPPRPFDTSMMTHAKIEPVFKGY